MRGNNEKVNLSNSDDIYKEMCYLTKLNVVVEGKLKLINRDNSKCDCIDRRLLAQISKNVVNKASTFRNKEKFPALIFRLKKFKSTVIIFESGCIRSLGSKSEKEGITSIKIILHKLNENIDKELHKKGIDHSFLLLDECYVSNIVSCFTFRSHIYLRKLEETVNNLNCKYITSNYDNESFSAAVYIKINNPDIKGKNKGKGPNIGVFNNGKVSIYGGKSETHIKNILSIIYPLLIKCEKK
jgi:TATA-box binding protein (TBP) (component of TFIID and TFIIIB)